MTNDIFLSEILIENLEIQVGEAICKARESGNVQLNSRATRLRERMQKFLRSYMKIRNESIMDPSFKQKNNEKFLKLGMEEKQISAEAKKLLMDSIS